VEAIQRNQQHRERKGDGAKNLGQPVDLQVQQANLGPRMACVHYRTGLRASVDDEPNGGASCKNSVAPQDILRGQWLDLGLRAIMERERADESVNVFDWRIRVDLRGKPEEVGVRRHALAGWNSDAEFPVGFTVELVGSDEARATGIARS